MSQLPLVLVSPPCHLPSQRYRRGNGSHHVPPWRSYLSSSSPCRTWLVINVSPSEYNAGETLSTLRFGTRAKAITNRAVVNQVRSVEELERLLAQASVRSVDTSLTRH